MSASKRLVVAIDGPAGAGKSTVSKRLTEALGYRLLDTGALYRAVAYAARQRGVAWDDEQGLGELARGLDIEFRLDGERNRVILAGQDVSDAIRTPEMSEGASIVSALGAVRAGLLDLQRSLGAEGGVVAEGRDIGTVVFPAAEIKFFLTASPEERARRRYEELVGRGQVVDFQSTLDDIVSRDQRDSQRDVAPLVCAEDALEVDSTGKGLDEVVAEMLAAVESRVCG